MSKLILKLIKQIVFRYAEHTPPEVKSSTRNYKVAAINLAIDNLIKDL